MKMWIRSVCAVGVAAGMAGAADAVVLAPRGTGQVLIYPYFSANAGNSTVLSVVNNDNRPKALLVRVAEGKTGNTLRAFNLYLAARDAWTAAIVKYGSGDLAALITNDDSCTVPAIHRSTTLPQLPDGRRYVPLPIPVGDGGGSDSARSREGFVEIIEMATVADGTPVQRDIDSTSADTVPLCNEVVSAWGTSGYWRTEPKRHLANPTGGLSGEAWIVNPAAGTLFSTRATALDDFRTDPADAPRGKLSSVVIHHLGVDTPEHPTLADALNDPINKTARATVAIDGGTVIATYPAERQGIDAVSAVLMSTTVSGEYDIQPEAGATTSYLLNFPTRRFYTDRALAGMPAMAIRPFREFFNGGNSAQQTMVIDYTIYDRTSMMYSSLIPPDGCGFLCPPDESVLETGTTVQVISPVVAGDPLLGSNLRGSLTDTQQNLDRIFRTGTVELAFNEWSGAELRPSNEGYRFIGLPVIGTRMVSYINSNVTPGVIANYTGATPMTSTLQCLAVSAKSCLP
ncbi:hypothetical protein [Tahibacter amnicola]|uniref:Uncharacterized protein n=1 Tax=Tahibacter amnicola TaxID=2976241 RepID=A0ABY6BI67_9GAMM|nr:hypothetical protein [Tahibacter amnicola]UXI68780.1 hypothetical protein N4264_03760 [Tahibacter amnicola]